MISNINECAKLDYTYNAESLKYRDSKSTEIKDQVSTWRFDSLIIY